MASFKYILVHLTINLCLCYGRIDQTNEDNANGVDVVDAVIKKIKDSEIFPDDNGFMKRVAFVETRFGSNTNTSRANFYGGIWGINNETFNEITMNRTKYPKLSDEFFLVIQKKFGGDIREMSYKKLIKPLYSGLVAHICLLIIKEKVPDHFEIQEQANYWKKNFNLGKEKCSVDHFVTEVETMEKEFGINCRGRMDLAIVMDGSGSIRLDNYKLALKFVIQLIKTFSSDSVDIGFVVFSDKSKVIFPLDSNLTQIQMQEIVLKSNYPSGSTYTNLGIENATKILVQSKSEKGIPKIMAIFTDGEPTCHAKDLDKSLKSARSNNITIFAIGIGSAIKQENLRKMTNSTSHVFSKSSYKSLSESFAMINSETCKIPQKPVVGSNLTDNLAKREKRYFHFEIPPQGITIKITITVGNTKGYYSYTHENPSSAMNDGQFQGQVYIPQKHSDSDRFKRDVSETTSVFVAIQGQEPNNNYTLATEHGNHVNGSNLNGINSFVVFVSLILASSKYLY